MGLESRALSPLLPGRQTSGLEQPAPVCAPLLAPVAAALLGTVFAKHPYLLMKASSISCLGKP